MGAEMSGREGTDFSIWTNTYREGQAELVPVNPPRRLESSGAPVVETSHEYVFPKRDEPRTPPHFTAAGRATP